MKTELRLLLTWFMVVLATGQAPRLFAREAEPPGRRVLIGFAPVLELQAAQERADIVGQAGGVVYATFDLIPVVSAWVPEQAVDALAGRPDVRYVEEDVVLQVGAESTPWGVSRVHADSVCRSGNSGAGVDVAILDTGIDGRHPDLQVVDGINFADPQDKDGSTDPADWNDNHGHGTHCAGIVAALRNGTGVVGVAPGVRLHAVKVCDDTGLAHTSDIIQGLEWCVANHIRVASLSLGGGSTTSLQEACDRTYAAGVLLVAAAGNARGPVSFPAAYPSVVAVSATDAQDQLASFSNFGPEIALAAPGVDIYSTYKGGAYAYMSGTSMACPHVTGVAALVWAAGAVSNVAVRAALTAGAQDLGPAGRDPSFGYGLVDAETAVAVPSVRITSPADGATVSGIALVQAATGGTSAVANVEFFAEAVSLGRGMPQADTWSLAWDTARFHNTTYQVTAVATDARGQTARHSIKLAVDNTPGKLPPAQPTALHVAALEMWATQAGPAYLIHTKVTVVDNASPTPLPVSGVTVSVTTARPNGNSVSKSAVTGADGTATLSIRSLSGGTFTSTVTALSGALPYEPGANLETRETCTVP